ncbi:hypothetical protein LX15_002728 [Streptoalloteichus tenebrarius]|uniref:Uncharacterized protein n=1 Tax=Streptoalloteichus tenebrarius (strain ATCC 17920 / DSM 40477 / JCM 4838 / CBS 697.72 / NBRC 16177 / NCIMB 11028 / NRRL B-12390 / A12253. 1 / ISP 5477) TaxID=1933 RepID=A0ABT1HU65_STRSD|nr:hypothetical protein [Streptoalloteichus tenebrarius]MCP2259027.1 hypothetical protein [Streptoalloteichus tenebrarius]BFE99648.1 hypothetical protein GCM10020241_13240 [Streptoalloteichus tenebrarius]
MTMRNDAQSDGRGESLADLAEALFCSPLRPEDRPSPDQVRDAVRASLRAHSGDPSTCACELAQAYGEYPEITVARMRWCREAVAEAFGLGMATT